MFLTKYKKNRATSIAIDSIQEVLSQTPAFVFSRTEARKKVDILKKSLLENWPGESLIAYSFKTNYYPVIKKVFTPKMVMAEVVSQKEYQMALSAGFSKKEILFNGPYKDPTCLKKHLNGGLVTIIDNWSDLKAVEKIWKDDYSGGVGMRVCTKLFRKKESRFGFSIDSDEAFLAFKSIYELFNNRLTTLHIHLGSNIDKISDYKTASKRILNFMKKIFSNYGFTFSVLDFGGGFPSSALKPYHTKTWDNRQIGDYISGIANPFKKYFDDSLPRLIVEPGRFLVEEAQVYVSKVKGVEDNRLIVDGSINQMPLVNYRPFEVHVYDPNFGLRKHVSKTKIYGATCQEVDVLYEGNLERAQVGDYCVFFDVGAYNNNMSSSFILNQPKNYIY